MPNFSHVIRLLSVSNQSSSLAIAKNQSFSTLAFSHKPLNSTKIPSLIALFLTSNTYPN